MPLIVFDAMKKQVVTVHCQQSVSEVEELLVDSKVSGAPMVSHDGRVMGVVSLSDITRFHSREHDKSPEETMVYEIGTPETVTISANASLRDAAQLMVARRIHRLVVVQGGRPVGILSTFDVVSAVASGKISAA